MKKSTESNTDTEQLASARDFARGVAAFIGPDDYESAVNILEEAVRRRDDIAHAEIERQRAIVWRLCDALAADPDVEKRALIMARDEWMRRHDEVEADLQSRVEEVGRLLREVERLNSWLRLFESGCFLPEHATMALRGESRPKR